MKKLIPVFLVVSILIYACQSKTSKTKEVIDSAIASKTLSDADCFLYAKNRDTAALTLKTEGDKVSGDLNYSLYEKDKNIGTITGIVKGDTIIADYTFQSEGTKSIRQVVWIKQGDKLLEGFGDVEEVDGKMRFKNISHLKFGHAIEFTKTNCK